MLVSDFCQIEDDVKYAIEFLKALHLEDKQSAQARELTLVKLSDVGAALGKLHARAIAEAAAAELERVASEESSFNQT